MDNRTSLESAQFTQSTSMVKDFFYAILSKWYWFVLSLIVCLFTAYYYVKSTNYIYQAKALVMLKSDAAKAGGMSESMLFSDMGVNSGVSQIETEMYTLRSTNLIEQVIDRLGIDISYTVKPMFRTADIYGANPISVTFIDKDMTGNVSFQIDNIRENEYSYNISGENKPTWIGAKYGDTITMNLGRFIVNKSPFYGNGFTNEQITVTLKKKNVVANNILSNILFIRPDRVTNALSISLKDNNAKRAADFLNTLIEVYNEVVINDKNVVANKTEKFIIERIGVISEDLGGIDSQIEQLKMNNSITDFNSTSNLLAQTGSRYKDEAVRLGTEISIVKFVREYLLDPLKKNDLIPTNTGIMDIGIESQISQYNELRLQLDKLLINSGPNNPITIEKSNNLNVLKANMIQSIDNLLSSLIIKQEGARNQESIANRRIASVPTQEKQVNDIGRQQKVKEELFLYLLNKREENALKLAITESNAKVIEFAKENSYPVSPNVPIIMLIAIVAGLMLPITVIIIIQWIHSLDTTIHNKQDVEHNSSITVIGELPQKHKSKDKQEIIVSESGRDRISEAFRVIRSNMAYVLRNDNDQAKVIQLTSTFPGEGKSYVTINLALSFAHIGKKVLLIDLDMRKAKLSEFLNLNSDIPGVSHFLSGKVDNIDSIVNSGVLSTSLDVITVGVIPPNPANLLMSDRFDTLMSQLKDRYDYIFIDTVPFLAIADAQSVNRVVDLTLYIIRNGMVEKRYLSEIEQLRGEGKINNLATLIVDVDVDNERYGYGYVEGESNSKKRRKIKK